MSLHRLFPKKRNAESEVDQGTLENNTTYTSNATMAPTHTLSGSDTHGVAGTSEVATPNYSTGTGTGKRPSGKFKRSSPTSHL